MPLYDYKCSKCNKITEVRHGFDDTHADACPSCGGSMTRLFNPAGIVFKGSGFYITDSRKSEAKTEAKPEKPAEAKPESKASSGGSSESAA